MNKIWIPALAVLMAGCVEKNSFRAAESVVAVRCPQTCEEGTNWFVAAAADLTNVLSRVTGRPVALYAEADLPANAAHVIYLGDTVAAKAAGLSAAELKRMEFRIKADGRNAFILANSGSAASYGVSEFLERFADFYFVSLNGDDDPVVRNPAMEIPVCDFRKAPAVCFRHLYDGYVTQGGLKRHRLNEKWWPEAFPKYYAFSRRTRSTGVIDEYEPSDRLSHQTKENHSSYWYVPPDKYFKDHPEYFAYYKADKQRHAKVSGGQLCYSSEGAFNAAYESLVGFIEADRKANPTDYPSLYDFTQQDHAGFCECELCEKVYAKYNRVKGDNRTGGAMAVQFLFMNRLARKIRAKYPDVALRTFAYASTEELPDNLTEAPEENLVFWYCDLFGFSDHLTPLGTGPLNGPRLKLLDKWLGFAKRLELWDYMLTGKYWGSGFPEVAVDAIAADAKLFAARGLKRLFSEHYPQDPLWELNRFVYGELMNDPTKDVEVLVDKHCRLYRRAAGKMREVIDCIRRETAAGRSKTEGQWMARALPWRNAKVFTHLRDLVVEAWELETDEAVRGRLARVLASLSDELMTLCKAEGDAAGCERAKREHVLYTERMLPRWITKPDQKTTALDAAKLAVKKNSVVFKDLPDELKGRSDVFMLDYLSYGARIKPVDDPDAESGKSFLQRKQAPGKAVPAGVYDFATKTSCRRLPGPGGVVFDAKTADGKYHWHRVGTYHLGESSIFFATSQWTPNWDLGSFYKMADGLSEDEDSNWFEIWVSVKAQGPDFVKGSTAENGVWADRIVLRRADPPKKRR